MVKKIRRYSGFLFRGLPIHIIQLLTNLLPNSSFTIRIRGFLLRPFFEKCGKGFKIASGVTLNRPENISIGDNVYIAHNTWINATGKLKIDDNVAIGPMCVIATSNHVIEKGLLTSKGKSGPVHIKSNAWLSSHVVVTSNVQIGEGTTIAAGSVVTKDIEAGKVAGGVPAKILNIKS